MSKVSIVALLLVSQVFSSAVVLAAEARNDQAAPAGRITVQLEATSNNPGKTGTAILVPVGKKTGMTIEISGVPNDTPRPIHLYAVLFEGSCAKRNSKPMYVQTKPGLARSLVDPSAIGAFIGPAQISQDVPIPFDKLQTTPFAISVRLGPEDGNIEIFCGDYAN